MSGDELVKRKRELRMESFNLRLQQQSGQMEKPSRVKDIRKEVARIETVITEKTRKAAAAATAKA